ncbi:DUF6382 domain-containing protein [Sinanaerobacter sp. ZZT-01]|uniref:DUF6382 domain-containing protein n=1 Tax=Sinanaerobacter sp. ZZT-01 TaxID=3111540 RepID=UPI002D76EC98|nr:DUF6382 domain-containing protein [Sinanaerobacter sp. ZZT-01]WRR92904.1 DUF6382 domain-containing protein [Sinanaerobacter sp. ZZT-01]
MIENVKILNETINGKQAIKRELPKEQIPWYQKQILSLSSTGFFLPMRFVFSEIMCEIYYECSQRTSLKEYLQQKKEVGIHSFVEEGIHLLEHLIEQIQQGEDHLLFLEDYTLSFDLLFVYESEKRVELLFLPKEDKVDFLEEWEDLLNAIDAEVNDKQWSVYSQKLIQLSKDQNWGTEAILSYIRELKGEIFYSS